MGKTAYTLGGSKEASLYFDNPRIIHREDVVFDDRLGCKSAADQGELLRNAHTGPMMNAMYVMAMVVLSPRLNFGALQAKWMYYWCIILLWGNTIGYSAAVYAPERGLQPIGDWPNLVSYAAFYSAVIGATITTGICLTNAIRAARSNH